MKVRGRKNFFGAFKATPRLNETKEKKAPREGQLK
jgi:hypothetical protein